MSQIRSIFKNASWVTISQIIVNICAFGWTIITARYLGVNDYGILSFAISFTVLLGMGTDIGISTYTTRELSRDRSKTHKFINNGIPVKIILSSILFVFTGLLLYVLGYETNIIIITLLISLETIFICMVNFINGIFQAYEELKYNSIGSIINSVFLLSLTALTVVLKLGLFYIALGYMVSYFICLIYMTYHLIKAFGVPKFEIDLEFWKNLCKNSIPFGLSIFFYTIYFSIDVVMISFISGDYATGIYNSAYKIISVFTAFYIIYQAVIFPVMSKYYVQSENLLKISYEQSIKYSLLILLPITVGVFIYSPYITNLVYSNQYALAAEPMKILIWTIIFLFLNGVTTSLLNSINKEKTVTKIYVIAAITNIVLNMIIIPYLSYNGASITTLISEILIFILMNYYISKTKYQADRKLLKTTVKLIISTLILTIVLYIINVSLWLAIPIGFVVYLIALFITKSLDETDKYILDEILGKN